MRHLILNYGSAYPEVVRYGEKGPHGLERIGDSSEVLRAEVLYGIRDEMAQTLADVVFRRTELGVLGNPGDASLATCAAIMSAELGWDKYRIDEEMKEVKAAYVLERACG
jgi:glycerol-3-phosphate dehydrogenase